MKDWEVQDLTDGEAKEYLERLIQRLDDLDEDDFFGTEGWRRFIMNED